MEKKASAEKAVRETRRRFLVEDSEFSRKRFALVVTPKSVNRSAQVNACTGVTAAESTGGCGTTLAPTGFGSMK